MAGAEPLIERELGLAGGQRLLGRYWLPQRPVVTVTHDGAELAQLDYGEASASNHWAIRIAHGDRETLLGMPALAGTVPEDLERDLSLAEAILDETLQAVGAWITAHGSP